MSKPEIAPGIFTWEQRAWLDSMKRVCPRADRVLLATELLRDAESGDVPDEPVHWVIHYADRNMPADHFGGPGAEAAARATFELRRAAWSCALYKEVARG